MNIFAAILTIFPLYAGCQSAPEITKPAMSKGTNQTQIRETDESAFHVRSEMQVAKSTSSRADILLLHHSISMENDNRSKLIGGNEVKLLIDGPQAYAAMFAAMEAARDHINLEAYILEDDAVGQKLQQLLLRKQREGVQVSLIYDSLGCLATPKSFFETLQQAGIRVYEFNPVNPVKGKILEVNNRDHRKLLIVDGTIGFSGGINISNVYAEGSGSSHWFRSSRSNNPSVKSGWRDTQIEVRGPAVAAMQTIFFDTWNRQPEDGRKPLGNLKPDYFPPIPVAGDKMLRVIASSGGDTENGIYVDLLSALQQAQSSIHLTMAYFSPDDQTIDILKQAAGRGVDVVLVLPGFSDFWPVLEAGRSHYSELLQAGVIIFERHDALMHAKTAVVDGVWSTVGSANMDMRSFLHNNEVNIIVLGDGFGAGMEAMFAQDIAKSEPITLQQWRRRGLGSRIKQWFSRAWSYWL